MTCRLHHLNLPQEDCDDVRSVVREGTAQTRCCRVPPAQSHVTPPETEGPGNVEAWGQGRHLHRLLNWPASPPVSCLTKL